MTAYYNQGYIDSYHDSFYVQYLSNPQFLNKVKDAFLMQYDNDANAGLIQLKESLDHYVTKKLSLNRSYIQTKEFKNYVNYLKTYIDTSKEGINYYTNVFFESLDPNLFVSLFGQEIYNRYLLTNRNYDAKMALIIKKLDSGQLLSDAELVFLASVLDNYKHYNIPKIIELNEKFAKYVLNNYVNCHNSILSAYGNFVLQKYWYKNPDIKEKKNDYRIFVGSKMFNDSSSTACYYTYRAIYFNPRQFNSIDLNSFSSLDSSRSVKDIDIGTYTMIINHEVTHAIQNLNSYTNSIRGLGMQINNIERNIYYINHDTSEIEIEADAEGWNKTRLLLRDYYFGKDCDNLTSKCYTNVAAVNFRRCFAVKRTNVNGSVEESIKFNINYLENCFKNDPKLRTRFPLVAKYFGDDGKLKQDIIYTESMGDPYEESSSREIYNYLVDNASASEIIDLFNSGKISSNNLDVFFKNIIEVTHSNDLILRQTFSNFDFDTYQGTGTLLTGRGDDFNQKHLTEVISDAKYFYLTKTVNQIILYLKVLSGVSNNYKNAHMMYEYCLKYGISYYLDSIFRSTLSNVDFDKLQNILDLMLQSGIPALVNLVPNYKKLIKIAFENQCIEKMLGIKLTSEVIANYNNGNINELGIDESKLYSNAKDVVSQLNELKSNGKIDEDTYNLIVNKLKSIYYSVFNYNNQDTNGSSSGARH